MADGALYPKQIFLLSSTGSLSRQNLQNLRVRLFFQGRCALVTGGASGIGYACALALSEQGAQVTVLDKDPSVLKVFDGTNIQGRVCDVKDADAVRDAVAESVATFGVSIFW